MVLKKIKSLGKRKKSNPPAPVLSMRESQSPGPWKTPNDRETREVYCSATHSLIARIKHQKGPREAHADALLIAQAPAMQALLEKLLSENALSIPDTLEAHAIMLKISGEQH